MSPTFKISRIRNKILAGYGAVILLVVGLALLITQVTFIFEQLDDQVLRDAVPDSIAISDMQKAGLDLVQSVTTLSATTIARKLAPNALDGTLNEAAGKLREKRAAFIKSIDAFRAVPSPVDDPDEYVKDLLEVVSDLVSDSKAYEGLMLQPDVDIAAILASVERASVNSKHFGELLTAALRQEQTELAEAAEGLEKGLATARWSIWISVIAVVAASLLAALVISRNIARPIGALHAAVLRIGEGDLSVKITKKNDDEVGDLAVAFDDMVRSLRDAKEKLMRSERLLVLGQVAGTVSHELRNPLASIQSSIDLMRTVANDKGPDFTRHLDLVDRNIERCDRIIGDLLEFTRIKELARQEIDVNSWVVDLLDEHALPDGVELRREFAARDIVASIDPVRFRQVIVNLLDNAAQALTEKGWTPNSARGRVVTVRTEAIDRQLRISIADNGPGIEPDNLNKIFEPLFTTKNFGVGLGLPTVRQLVEQHGGKVEVESSRGAGTRFMIHLPLAAGRAARDLPSKVA